MKYKAILLDFYGTLVEEDDEIISSLCKKLAFSSQKKASESDIGYYWWKKFSNLCNASYHDGFEKQFILEQMSLEATAKEFDINCNIDDLSNELFKYWSHPNPFPETEIFLKQLEVPSIIVSNIDNVNIEQAIKFTNHSFSGIITSENVKAYKPRTEIFDAALERIGFEKDEVIHVGDSVSLDVCGANNIGVDVVWMNRKQKKAPEGIKIIAECKSLLEVLNIFQ